MADGGAVAELQVPKGLALDFAPLGSDAAPDVPWQSEGTVTEPELRISDDASVGDFQFSWTKTPDPEAEPIFVIDLRGHLPRRVQSLIDRIETSLLEDRKEGLLYGEVCASDLAVAGCKRIAIHIQEWLAPSSGLKWAAFGEETGSVSLVLRSVVTDRRVDFRISSDGLEISAISIDADLAATSVPIALKDRNALRERAAWVHTGS